jgi:hypothetical protein
MVQQREQPATAILHLAGKAGATFTISRRLTMASVSTIPYLQFPQPEQESIVILLIMTGFMKR